MKYMTHNSASTTWVALNRSRIVSLPDFLLLWLFAATLPALAVVRLSGLDHLQMPWGIRGRTLFQRRHRGVDAAGAMRHARGSKTHLHTGQGSHQGELVALAEVSDAKHLARDFAQAGTE